MRNFPPLCFHKKLLLRSSCNSQSALTSFLASHNISARQIRDSALQRQQQSEQANAAAGPSPTAEQDEDDEETEVAESSRAGARKRKRGPDEAAKAKAAASVAREKAQAKKNKSKKKRKDDDDDDEDFNIGAEMYKKSVPRPGQLENCEICSKRFTVTAYSLSGPEGGLLCTPCGKKQKDEDKKLNKLPKKAGTGKKRRQTESNRLDGLVHAGPKTLQELCIEKVAKYHDDIDEFGDLPESLLGRLSEIFSKRRVLNPRTLPLFLRPDLAEVAIDDAAYLEEADYKQIFAVVQHLRKLVLRNACQFKDGVVDYMMDKSKHIEHFQVYGANLVSDSKWLQLFPALGANLKTLRLTWLDAAFDDDSVRCAVEHCPNISSLKLKYCRRLTPACLASIAQLRKLEHLSLHLSVSPDPEQLVQLITALGPGLRTLSLENFVEIDDSVIAAIATSCPALHKLRLTDLDCVTDAALAALFTTSSSTTTVTLADGTESTTKSSMPTALPPLRCLDLSSARDVDYSNPLGPDAPVGLADASFRALMAHSGRSLHTLRIPSCRHVSLAAFLDVFSGDSTYGQLRELNVSFCSNVDTTTIIGVFKSCPSLQKVIAFGCFGVEDPVVPVGVALIGVPRAQDTIERVGGFTESGTSFMEGLSTVAAVGA